MSIHNFLTAHWFDPLRYLHHYELAEIILSLNTIFLKKNISLLSLKQQKYLRGFFSTFPFQVLEKKRKLILLPAPLIFPGIQLTNENVPGSNFLY